MWKELRQPGVKKQAELLSLTYGLAALVFKEESEHLWLQRRFAMIDDVINESWAFQDLIQRGRKEGIEEAKKQDLLLFIQTYFPNLSQTAQNVCNDIQSLEELQGLFEKVLLAKDEEKVRRILLDARK